LLASIFGDVCIGIFSIETHYRILKKTSSLLAFYHIIQLTKQFSLFLAQNDNMAPQSSYKNSSSLHLPACIANIGSS
jgi:hypothetical protein